MKDNNIKRLPRLTAILTLFQTKRLLTATELAHKFEVSSRTIYRDIKTLEQAGIPILTEDGKGYYLMEGYKIPPVMFTETEANALITAEQFILRNKDASFIKEYSNAINKIKAVLRYGTQDKTNLLASRIQIRQNAESQQTSNYLSVIQLALTSFNLLEIKYNSFENQQLTIRIIEPFALYSTQENWILVAYCRLRSDFRSFRLDRIDGLNVLNERFESHQMTLLEFIEKYHKFSNTLDI